MVAVNPSRAVDGTYVLHPVKPPPPRSASVCGTTGEDGGSICCVTLAGDDGSGHLSVALDIQPFFPTPQPPSHSCAGACDGELG